ncbi:hypothetical protein D1007_12464 [Hordeum vulgare]|nr:hypothetical protein D1007_12464 [Hordeum vulgare]
MDVAEGVDSPRPELELGLGGIGLLVPAVGRPREITFKACDDRDNPIWLPTWAYKWDVVLEMRGDVNIMYMQYTNEMDSLTAEQVEWHAYGVGDRFGEALTFQLNPMCLEEKHLRLMQCPLICNWAIECHLPHLVFHQFELFQSHPPEWVNMNLQVHTLDRRKQRKIKDWDKQHNKYVTTFELCVERAKSTTGSQLREYYTLAFNKYVRWLQENTHVEICPPAFEEETLEDPTAFDELG